MITDSPKSEFVKLIFFRACLDFFRACPFSKTTGLSMKKVFLEPCVYPKTNLIMSSKTWIRKRFFNLSLMGFCVFQLPTNGLYQQSGVTSLLVVQLMVLSVMVRVSWCLVEWWSMGNIPMSYMSYRPVDGNGNGWNQRILEQDLHPVQDLVKKLNIAVTIYFS